MWGLGEPGAAGRAWDLDGSGMGSPGWTFILLQLWGEYLGVPTLCTPSCCPALFSCLIPHQNHPELLGAWALTGSLEEPKP